MVIIAGIRSSKSLLFQILPLIIKNTIVLIIMSTLALMEDQYQWIKKYGILVVVLIANVIVADPTIWKKIKAEDYVVVFASPEVFLQYASIILLRII